MHHAEEGRLDRLDRIALVVDRRRRAGKVVDLVELAPERLRHIVQDEGETRVVHQVIDVGLCPREEIVHDGDFVARLQQTARKMGTDEAGPAGDE